MAELADVTVAPPLPNPPWVPVRLDEAEDQRTRIARRHYSHIFNICPIVTTGHFSKIRNDRGMLPSDSGASGASKEGKIMTATPFDDEVGLYPVLVNGPDEHSLRQVRSTEGIPGLKGR